MNRCRRGLQKEKLMSTRTRIPEPTSRSFWKTRSHFFNFLNIALLVLVLFVRSYKNSMFMGIILINTVIGIIQEIRAKKTIDKLAILTESKTVVLREGKKWSISTEKLVLDDLIFLKTGDQVPADVKVLEEL